MRVPRYIEGSVREALDKKTVLIGGPQLVGKTTSALGFLGKDADERHPAYLSAGPPGSRLDPLAALRHE